MTPLATTFNPLCEHSRKLANSVLRIAAKIIGESGYFSDALLDCAVFMQMDNEKTLFWMVYDHGTFIRDTAEQCADLAKSCGIVAQVFEVTRCGNEFVIVRPGDAE